MNKLIENLSQAFAKCNLDGDLDKVNMISNILKNIHLEPDDYKQWVHTNDSHYTYSVIHRDDDYELLLLIWLPYQQTIKHPHLSWDNNIHSDCWYKILKGEIDEYVFCKNNSEDFIKNNRKLNDVAYIHDSIGQHKMINDAHLTISLHVYSPFLRSHEDILPKNHINV